MKKQRGHLYEVRIYDGEGNLKEVVQPEIDYDNTNWGNSKTRKPFNRTPAEKKGENKMTYAEKELLNKFADRSQRAEEIVGMLERHFKENSLPDVNNPKDPTDADFSISTCATNLNWFANKLEDLALELGELAEYMKVGTQMEKAWEEREENCYADIEEKRQDHGVRPRDFA